MVVPLKTKAELEELKLHLEKSGPRGWKILKHVEFELKVGSGRQEFIANKWPLPTVVLQKTTKLQMCPFLSGSCLLYTSRVDVAEELDEFFTHDVLDWSQPWTFAGTKRDLYDKLAEIASKNGAQIESKEELIEANTLEFKLPAIERALPEGYHYSGPIKSEADIAKVNSVWKFGGGEASFEYVKLNAGNMHSCGVKDEQDNLVAFELQTCYGTAGMLHVDPEHRGKGLGSYVMAKLAKILQDDGQKVFCYIDIGNEESHKIHTNFGYEVLEGGEVMWVRCFPKGCNTCKTIKACCT